MAERIGILGGTFDPPHVGHLWLAETARDQLGLDQVLFIPVGEPPHKPKSGLTAVAHRLAMTKLAIDPNDDFALDVSDIDRPPPHTTVTLLPIVQANYPQANLWLLLGADSLRDFTSWAGPGKIIQQCRLAVLGRPQAKIDWQELETAVPDIHRAVDFLSGPTTNISSTDIRNWVHDGHSLKYIVPEEVDSYIKKNQLYI